MDILTKPTIPRQNNIAVTQLLLLHHHVSTAAWSVPQLRQPSVAPHRQTGQADVGLGKQVDVQRVAVQTDVLQVAADEVAVVAVTEGVLMQRLDVVVLIVR